jgi:hypothetical protein
MCHIFSDFHLVVVLQSYMQEGELLAFLDVSVLWCAGFYCTHVPGWGQPARHAPALLLRTRATNASCQRPGIDGRCDVLSHFDMRTLSGMGVYW